MIRTDFVSNSSSSSFVLKTIKNMKDEKTYKEFLRFFTSKNQLDDYNVNEYKYALENGNVVFSIFQIEFLKDLNDEAKYDKYYELPPMEYLNPNNEKIDDIIKNMFEDKQGGFQNNGWFFVHEDFVFGHRGLCVLNLDSIEYTRKILKMIKDEGWSPTLYDPKYYRIINHLDKYEDEKGYKHPKEITMEEAEKFLDKLEEELLNDVNYIVIAMSYQGDGQDNGKLWYDKDFEKEKSCYDLIKENNFGETFYLDW